MEGNIEPSKGEHVEQEVLESYQPLCIVEKDRHTFYHTFTGLADNIDIAYGNGRFKLPYNNGRVYVFYQPCEKRQEKWRMRRLAFVRRLPLTP